MIIRQLTMPAMALAACFICAGIVLGETWSDATGQFKLEAEFVGVKGKNIVLRKQDGNTIEVPIAKLSAESRALAKQLYEQSQPGGAAPTPTSPTPSLSPTASPSLAREPAAGPAVNFTPPQPVAVAAMPAFPENASLQETVDFVLKQTLAGHPEVFWHSLPADIRSELDSDELRTMLTSYIKEQAATNKQTEALMLRAAEVLVTKKEFVLNSSMMGQLPPPALPMIKQGYDPAVGVLYEVIMFSSATSDIENRTITEIVDYHGPRIGGHLNALSKMLPPGAIEDVMSRVTVAQTDDTSGTITSPGNQGGTQTTEMTKYNGRWIPKELADRWSASKGNFKSELESALKAAQPDAQALQQQQQMVGMFVTMANGILEPMLKAQTQQEFDQALAQVVGMVQMMSGAAAGGPPGGF